MYISWLGQACFKIQEKSGSDGVTIITDPFDAAYTGLRAVRSEADIVTISHDHQDHNNKSAIKGDPYIIDVAGEYEIKNVAIEGVETFHDDKKGGTKGKNIAYRIEMDEIVLVHLGDLGHTLDPKQLEKLVGADILLIPVGGSYTLDAKKAVEVVSQIEPRIVIPMHFGIPDANKFNLDGVDKFIKEMGIKPRQEDKLKISKKDLPQDAMELIVLNY